MSAQDAFFATNYVLRTGATVTAAAKLFGVDAFQFSVYTTTIMWLWCFFLQARFEAKHLTKARVQNRTPRGYKRNFQLRIRRIIDCYPVYTRMTSSRKLRRAMYNKQVVLRVCALLCCCTWHAPGMAWRVALLNLAWRRADLDASANRVNVCARVCVRVVERYYGKPPPRSCWG